MKKGQSAKLIAAKREAFNRKYEEARINGHDKRSATMSAYKSVAAMDGKTAQRVASTSGVHVGMVQIRGGLKGAPAGVIQTIIYSDEASHFLALDQGETVCSRWKSLTMFSDWQFAIVDIPGAKI